MKENLKSMFTRNLGLKFLSVLISGILWIIIMSLSDPKMTVTIEDIPVERLNENLVLDKNMTYDIVSGEKIDIKVSGARSFVQKLSSGDFRAYVDFGEIGFNAAQIHVEPKSEDIANAITIVSQSSANMGISLVQTETESFAVEVKTTDVEEGYYAFCSSMSSKLLYVTGSKSQVDLVDKLVGTVSLVGHKESFTTTVNLAAVNHEGVVIEGENLDISQNRIQVEITILPVKEIPIVFDSSKVNMAEGFGLSAVDFSPKMVTVAAEQSVLNSLKEIKINYETNDLMRDEEGEIDLSKFIPEGVYLKSENTVAVSLKVELLKSREMYVSTNSIEVRELPEMWTVSFDDSLATVEVYGLESVVSQITSEDLQLYVDMSTCDRAGTFNVSIKNDGEILIGNDPKVSITVSPTIRMNSGE